MRNKFEFDRIKVGDTVAWNKRFGNGTMIATVEKVTKTMFTANGVRFNKETGRSVGSDSWTTVYAFIPTEEEISAAKNADKKARLVRILGSVDFTSLNLEDLEAIYKIVKKTV